MRFALSAILALTLALTLRAQEPSLVAPTNALTPAEEQKKLIVPEGFEIQLVASEPDIQKPMQMAFDAKGRLWVTSSYHYPFAAPAGKGTDKLFILSDFGPDGKAKKIQTFAADLNIPIGILPLPDCNSCIVSSVGEILKLTDTDGDGKYDKKQVLFTGLGSKDTHGMYNSFTLMPDGWVYACHGFNNDSKTKGKDGHEVAMQSGNTFRFRPDGSRIEVYTRGQVNPFGMAVDPWFNLYTADCHSKPITQLIPGAVYESFGKPHDGLGYGPTMFGYDPGGTGLCGLSWYDADYFPKQYKGCMFLGNVVTSRVNMCKIEWTGATPKAVQQPDFVKSDDPWFRPVDIKLGPDGAIYISDFYNKIIGHYEVDLKHPGRDKDRGRLWRVVKKGDQPRMAFEDLTKDKVDASLLANSNLTVRLLATNQIIAREKGWKDSLQKGSEELKGEAARRALSHAAWINPDITLAYVLSDDKDVRNDFVLSHFIRASNEYRRKKDVAKTEDLVRLYQFGPQTCRASVEDIVAHPHPDFVKPLVELLQKIPRGDTTLRHAARIALRNCLRDGDFIPAWKVAKALPKETAPIVSDVALGIPKFEASEYLVGLIASGSISEDRFAAVAEHAGRYGDNAQWWSVTRHAEKWKDGGTKAMVMLHALVRGVQARGNRLPVDIADVLFARTFSEAAEGNNDSKVAALKVIADLPTVVSESFRFDRTNFDSLGKWLEDPKQPDEIRSTALDTLLRLDAKIGLVTSEKLIDAVETSPILRERAALILAASADRNHKQAAKDAIKSVPYRSGVVIATALAGNAVGGEILLEAVKQGKAPARVLQEKLVLDRLRAARIENLDKQLADLTKGLQPADQKLAELIKQRTVKFTSAKLDKEAGLKLYTKHCAACHKIGEAGGKVGPNLDGIGVRGLERLLEDTLDPNRNVDAAFRARVLDLVDGTTKTGLMLRVEGEVLVMADDMGKEFRVPTKDIEKNRETMLSPMPANFGEVIPEAEFFLIVGYLLDQKGK